MYKLRNRMKRLIIIVFIVVLAICALLITLYLKWERLPKTVSSIYVLDKTVSRSDYNEHKSLFWILNSLRIVKPDSTSYQYSKDYYGFYPVDPTKGTFDFRSIRIAQINHFADSLDLVYYVDCYGVYSDDWMGKHESNIGQKIYGGLNQNDFLLLKAMKEKGKPIIAEYNLFSNLGSGLVRNKVASLFGFTYTGWIGRAYEKFDSLSTDGPPHWLINLYQNSTGKLWPNSKGGVVFVGSDGTVLLLYKGQQLKSTTINVISTEEAVRTFKVDPVVPYGRWFEIIKVPADFKVYSTYLLDLTPEGISLLQSNGIPAVFPAMVSSAQNGTIYYFAGDFAHTPSYLFTSYLWGSSTINRLLSYALRPSGYKFFNNYYQPLITSILSNCCVKPDSVAMQRKRKLLPLK